MDRSVRFGLYIQGNHRSSLRFMESDRKLREVLDERERTGGYR